MAEQGKTQQDQKNRRSHRRAPVIELKAEEITPVAEAQTASEPVASAEPVVTPTDRPAEPSAETKPEPENKPEPEIKPEPRPEPLVTPSPPAPPPSRALPLAAAALLGAVFGGLGGTVAPAIFGGGASVDNSRLTAIEARQTEIARQVSGSNPAALAQVQQKVTALEADVAKRVTDAAAPLAQNLQKLEGDVRALANRPTATAPAAAAPVDLSPLQQRITALEAQIKALDAKAETAAKAADPRLAALDQRVDQTARRVEAGSAAPLFSAVQGLAQAFHRGAPFQNEITAVEVLGAKPEQLAALKPLAEKGAPTAQRMAESFAPLAARLAGAEQGGVMGFINRFVTIRPSGETAGDQPAAIVGSIEGALRRGDVSAAVTAWGRLPEAARSASAAWGADATRRDQAAKALAALQDAATAALRK
jgi:hypothetical protein